MYADWIEPLNHTIYYIVLDDANIYKAIHNLLAIVKSIRLNSKVAENPMGK